MKLIDEKIKYFIAANLDSTDAELIPIKRGGSDRHFFRVLLPDLSSLIFMHYGTDVAENANWAGINRFLAGLNIAVPRIFARDEVQHFILLEDLGDVDLWSQRNLPWDKRRDYYFQVLRQIRLLHAFSLDQIPSGLQLSAGYDEKLYRWEHQYFQENFIGEVCKLQLSLSLLKDWKEELDALIIRLQKIEPSLIHRDFQSQNIMIKNEKTVLIDFQGLRKGCLFYDLGSLICDSYVSFSESERDELINFYYKLMQPAYGRSEFEINFWEASAQRLMQALGAYGYLGLQKKKTAFLQHINNGINNLLTAATYAATLPVLQEVAGACVQKLAKDKL
jgi:aminoglycoside/choline kinase family phosphotransferase